MLILHAPVSAQVITISRGALLCLHSALAPAVGAVPRCAAPLGESGGRFMLVSQHAAAFGTINWLRSHAVVHSDDGVLVAPCTSPQQSMAGCSCSHPQAADIVSDITARVAASPAAARVAAAAAAAP